MVAIILLDFHVFAFILVLNTLKWLLEILHLILLKLFVFRTAIWKDRHVVDRLIPHHLSLNLLVVEVEEGVGMLTHEHLILRRVEVHGV